MTNFRFITVLLLTALIGAATVYAEMEDQEITIDPELSEELSLEESRMEEQDPPDDFEESYESATESNNVDKMGDHKRKKIDAINAKIKAEAKNKAQSQSVSAKNKKNMKYNQDGRTPRARHKKSMHDARVQPNNPGRASGKSSVAKQKIAQSAKAKPSWQKKRKSAKNNSDQTGHNP